MVQLSSLRSTILFWFKTNDGDYHNYSHASPNMYLLSIKHVAVKRLKNRGGNYFTIIMDPNVVMSSWEKNV